jgi:isoquinoline 1-oxidoreductase beta subunit
MRKTSTDRRSFLRASILAGGGLMLGIHVRAASQSGSSTAASQPRVRADDLLEPDDFIAISASGEVEIASRNPEHGQGIHNMLAMLVAEELDVEWRSVKVRRANCDNKYGTQFTGGSIGTPSNWEPMRRVGGAARMMLISAAARQWNVAPDECSTTPGRVVHQASGRTAGYGELATAAAALSPPALKSVKLKDPHNYRIIGQTTKGDENRAIVTGQPIYGIDVTLPGMLYAVYQRSPVYGGRPLSANLDLIRKLKGVRHAFIVEGQPAPKEYVNYLTQDHGLEPGIAIVAESWWLAQSAREKLEVKWEDGNAAAQNSVDFARRADELSKQAPARTLRKDGDVASVFNRGDLKTVESRYVFPFIAHAPLEPQNCTAHFHQGQLDIWSTSQTPQIGRGMLARLLNIPESSVNIQMRRGGGGFGRRLYNDYM